jgi:hypothetical protein
MAFDHFAGADQWRESGRRAATGVGTATMKTFARRSAGSALPARLCATAGSGASTSPVTSCPFSGCTTHAVDIETDGRQLRRDRQQRAATTQSDHGDYAPGKSHAKSAAFDRSLGRDALHAAPASAVVGVPAASTAAGS